LPKETKDLVIEDWPVLGLRGFMLDVVRDFRTKEEVFKVLDIMASYKLNMLHFHLGDDESWCLEIPKLPELTAYSAHHELPDWDLKETKALKPTANGRIGTSTFYTEEEYKEILKYAAERQIAVVPEFDAPGHSRASIKAMQAYELRTGDNTYRLQDPADTSHYWTAQDFTDNVLDPELPGVYKFYGVVFDEVIRMHQEAGVPLLGVHIGGDEVPDGAWSGRDRKKVKDTFTRGMVQLAQERNLKLAGWQEMVENIEPETLEALKKQLLFVNAWSTLKKNVDLPARLANADIPVLLSNVQHAYVDLAYSDDPNDIGLHWGGYVDERKGYALPVYSYPGLQKPENIVGAEALLWSENIRSLDNATFQMLPKALGVWERAWNPCKEWKDDEEFQKDFNEFYSIIVKKEMPLWDAEGLNYKKR
jgi:hexosaminidase